MTPTAIFPCTMKTTPPNISFIVTSRRPASAFPIRSASFAL